MIEDPGQLLVRTSGKWAQRRFLVAILIAIGIALFLTGVALALYASSGAAQLDLSRPGYQSVREQASRSYSFSGFPATGAIDKPALEQFEKMYDERANQATSVEGFGGDGMSDESLSINP